MIFFKSAFSLSLGLFLAAPSAHAFGGTIAIAGDSWALLPCFFNSIQGAIRATQIPADVVACMGTTGFRVHASNWLSRKEHQNLMWILKNRRDVNVLYLSLGGNDFLEWNKDMSAAEEEALYVKIRANMKSILDTLLAVRPDFKILISGYDYPRFFSEHADIGVYDRKYRSAHSPSVYEMNSALQRYSLAMLPLADGKRVFYIHHLGVNQYYHGSKETGLKPFTTLAPEFISSPEHPGQMGGDVNSEQDYDAMLGVVGYTDSYHLSPNSFFNVVMHSFQHYIKKWMMEMPQTVASSSQAIMSSKEE